MRISEFWTYGLSLTVECVREIVLSVLLCFLFLKWCLPVPFCVCPNKGLGFVFIKEHRKCGIRERIKDTFL